MDDLRQPTDEPTEADPLISGPISTSTAVRDALTEMFGDAWQEWSDEATGAAAAVLMWLSSNDRLVGGRSAAPTRDEVLALSEAATRLTLNWRLNERIGDDVVALDEANDAVVALLSLSAAEPPRGRVDVAALIESLAEGLAAYEGTDDEQLHQSMARHLVGWFIAEGWRVWRLSPEDRCVAAEPNEEHGDVGSHLPPSAWQESPMAAPRPEPFDDWRKDDRTL